MRSIISQSIVLPAPAATLYETYLDPVRHAELTGAPVEIGIQPGAAFRAFDGAITGTMLCVRPPLLVLQSWRSINFHATDSDSTLILAFVPQGRDGRIELIQIDVPEQDYQGVTTGWEKFYWAPWRKLLSKAQSSER
ncbi:MAG TPA: SRPBCC domain-containing protein [Steroidobacteraceae bacterium]